MKYNTVLFLILYSAFAFGSSDAKHDSLIAYAQDTKIDSPWIVKRLLNTASSIRNNYPNKAIELIDQAIKIQSVDSPKSKIKGKLLGTKGQIYNSLERPDIAIPILMNCLTHFEEVNYYIGQIITHINLSSSFSLIYDFKNAFKHLYAADSISFASNHLDYRASILGNIARLYSNQQKTDKALETLLQVDELHFDKGNEVGKAINKSNIALEYLKDNQYEKALIYCRRAIPLLRKANHGQGEASCLVNLGVILDSLGSDSSYFYYILAEEKAKEHQSNDVLSVAINNQANFLLKKGKVNECIKKSLESLALIGINKSHLRKMGTYYTLSKAYKAKGDYKNALVYFESYKNSSDSLNKKTHTAEVGELELKYDIHLKDKELSEYKLRNNLQEKKAERNKIITISLIVILVLMLIVILANRKNNIQKKKFNKELQTRNDKLIEINQALETKKQSLDITYSRINFIANKLDSCIMFIDSDLKIRFVNQSMLNLINIEHESKIREMHIDEVYNRLDIKQLNKLSDAFKKAIQQKSDSQQEIELASTHYDLNISYLDANQKYSGYLFLLRDISETKQYQSNLLAVLKESDKFNAIVAHDLRGPLNNIEQLINLLLTSENTPKAEYELIHKSATNAKLIIESLLKNFLSTSTFSTNSKQEIKVHYLIMDCIKRFKYEFIDKKIKRQYNYKSKEIILNINGIDLQRVIDNCISNALKFTPEGKYIYINLNEDKENVYIEIKDEGIGIPKKLQSDLFTKLGTSRRKGLRGEPTFGMGMSIIKDIIENEGGEIKLLSTENEGTSITFVFKKNN